jgi:hypothetical protein
MGSESRSTASAVTHHRDRFASLAMTARHCEKRKRRSDLALSRVAVGASCREWQRDRFVTALPAMTIVGLPATTVEREL